MKDEAATLVRKLWRYCNVLRDDGLSYPDYVEQLTYLLFLKMSEEQVNGPVPAKYGWRALAALDAKAMHRQYSCNLSALGARPGLLGVIFGNARNKIRDPRKLKLLVTDLIGTTDWIGLSSDVKGDAYEGLLEKNARDTKSGAGQYFTPRPLTSAIVECVRPQLGEVVCDPACGTGGFLLAAYEYLEGSVSSMSPSQRRHLRTKAIHGVELVEEVARLAAMNLLLHGIADRRYDTVPIVCADSLREKPRKRVDVVLTNPPFGTKGSAGSRESARKGVDGKDELAVARSDFWAQTANKQLNFLQHVVSLLKPGGRAAVVVPDNVLFEGGAATSVRRHLLETCDVHTLLRLPKGLFYAQGIKANVLFFDRMRSEDRASSQLLWVYDLRSDSRRVSLKTNPLQREDLAEFVRVFRPGARGARARQGSAARDVKRWRSFEVEVILKTDDVSLDLSWDGGDSVGVRSVVDLDEMSRLIAEDLRRALAIVTDVRER